MHKINEVVGGGINVCIEDIQSVAMIIQPCTIHYSESQTVRTYPTCMLMEMGEVFVPNMINSLTKLQLLALQVTPSIDCSSLVHI